MHGNAILSRFSLENVRLEPFSTNPMIGTKRN